MLTRFGVGSAQSSWLGGVLLFGVVLALYWQTPSGTFHFDDFSNIVQVSALHVNTWTWQAVSNVFGNSYLVNRPLSNLSFALNWSQGEGSPTPFLWTNVLVHAAVSLLVFSLFNLVRPLEAKPRPWFWFALGASALWALHPIQAQAVAYIVQRMASMAALFVLVSVCSYILWRKTHRARFLVGALVAFGLGLASKENAGITPYLWLLAEYTVIKDLQKLRKVDVLIIGVALLPVLVVTIDLLSAGPFFQWLQSGYANRPFTMDERLLTQPRVIVFHISQFFWPLPDRFSLEHDFPISRSLFDPLSTAVSIGAVFLWCCVGFFAVIRQQFRVLGFFVLWVPATLVIESSFVPLELVFEHRFYLPSIGLAGVLLYALYIMAGVSQVKQTIVAALLICSLIAIGWSLQERLRVWRSPVELYEQAVRHAPNSWRAWNYLGIYHMDRGDLASAQSAIERSMAVAVSAGLPIQGASHNHLGEIYLRRKNFGAALDAFQLALLQDSDKPAYRWNIAWTLEQMGRCEESELAWRAFLQLPKATDLDKMEVLQHLRGEYQASDGVCFLRSNAS